MPSDRQQRQHNPLTSKNADEHMVSSRQHRQRPQPLTQLTSADARQHPKTAGQRVPLTLLTPPATPYIAECAATAAEAAGTVHRRIGELAEFDKLPDLPDHTHCLEADC
ncbi:hypothetical protein [Streptomyces sp. 35G-GA-8]|uniref:hypothetical protein n=1 Tax=Streptomyces sp. 35G-GA-8 TaxID=2939434 RepID=UPI00201F49C1|nr:hypothetical protein [Streptomyces sp. 35G-GA-8]MCL7379613.1 hypothetical protein [Streptomyces sp. 35G-GA-8]